MDCIFCKIANKEIPAEVVFEDERIMAFKDIHPIAPVHILIIPKKHIGSIDDLAEDDIDLVGYMVFKAKELANSESISTGGPQKGYKLLFRTGPWGGQEVEHIHLHLIGGAELHEEIRKV